MDRRSDLSVVAIVFLAFLLWQVVSGGAVEVIGSVSTLESGEITQPTLSPTPVIDHITFSAPYDEFWITQRLHGQSYGHLAIDISGGKGATIRSPINGVVTERYMDGYGNTVLIIENDIWQVTMYHGNYTAAQGERVVLGQPLGTEWNHGYTTDMQGRSCRDRDCGYHTHLNVLDKRIGKNINPLRLLGIE